MEPIFLTLGEVLEIHERQIAAFGGSAGVRDPGLLLSAIAMPAAGFGGEYLHATHYAMAAAYLFHIAKNHPFVDGNKRTALHAATVFLELNDVRYAAPDNVEEEMVMATAEGRLDKEAIAAFFREHSQL